MVTSAKEKPSIIKPHWRNPIPPSMIQIDKIQGTFPTEEADNTAKLIVIFCQKNHDAWQPFAPQQIRDISGLYGKVDFDSLAGKDHEPAMIQPAEKGRILPTQEFINLVFEHAKAFKHPEK